MRIDFYVKWHTAMTCTAPEYVHKQLIIIHVVCCDAMTFLFIVRCHSTEYWNKNEKRNRVNQMYTQSSNNNNKCHTHTYSHTHANICSLSQSDLQSTTIENIVYKLNKTKSSWKLKTYTCYCSIKKKHTEQHNPCVCVCSDSEWSKFIRHRNESNLLPKNAHSCRSFIVQLSLEM